MLRVDVVPVDTGNTEEHKIKGTMETSTESTTYICNDIDINIVRDKDNVIGNIINSNTTTASISNNTAITIQDDENNDVISNLPDKVKIHFVAVGSAPILKRTKFQINADQRFAAVHVFLRKLLKLSSTENNNNNNNNSTNSQNNLFLYCCSAFVPSHDHLIGELRDSFANVHSKELVIHYSLQEAWG